MLSKRYPILAIILLVAVVLGSCAPAPAAPTEAPAPPPTEAAPPPTQAMEEPTAEMAAPTEAAGPDLAGMKVAFLFPGVVNDGSYNTLGYNAMLDVEKRFGLEVQWNERVPPAESPRVIGEFAASGVDAVWAHSGTFFDPIINTAPNFPDGGDRRAYDGEQCDRLRRWDRADNLRGGAKFLRDGSQVGQSAGAALEGMDGGLRRRGPGEGSHHRTHRAGSGRDRPRHQPGRVRDRRGH